MLTRSGSPLAAHVDLASRVRTRQVEAEAKRRTGALGARLMVRLTGRLSLVATTSVCLPGHRGRIAAAAIARQIATRVPPARRRHCKLRAAAHAGAVARALPPAWQRARSRPLGHAARKAHVSLSVFGSQPRGRRSPALPISVTTIPTSTSCFGPRTWMKSASSSRLRTVGARYAPPHRRRDPVSRRRCGRVARMGLCGSWRMRAGEEHRWRKVMLVERRGALRATRARNGAGMIVVALRAPRLRLRRRSGVRGHRKGLRLAACGRARALSEAGSGEPPRFGRACRHGRVDVHREPVRAVALLRRGRGGALRARPSKICRRAASARQAARCSPRRAASATHHAAPFFRWDPMRRWGAR